MSRKPFRLPLLLQSIVLPLAIAGTHVFGVVLPGDAKRTFILSLITIIQNAPGKPQIDFATFANQRQSKPAPLFVQSALPQRYNDVVRATLSLLKTTNSFELGQTAA